jgi:hypothetical protein
LRSKADRQRLQAGTSEPAVDSSGPAVRRVFLPASEPPGLSFPGNPPAVAARSPRNVSTPAGFQPLRRKNPSMLRWHGNRSRLPDSIHEPPSPANSRGPSGFGFSTQSTT